MQLPGLDRLYTGLLDIRGDLNGFSFCTMPLFYLFGLSVMSGTTYGEQVFLLLLRLLLAYLLQLQLLPLLHLLILLLMRWFHGATGFGATVPIAGGG